MGMNRREFVQVMGIAAAGGMALNAKAAFAAPSADKLYDVPRFGNVHFLHFTDCHAQLLPIYFREPSVNLGVGDAVGRLPHLVGDKLLKQVDVPANSSQAYAFSY